MGTFMSPPHCRVVGEPERCSMLESVPGAQRQLQLPQTRGSKSFTQPGLSFECYFFQSS